MAKKEKEEDSTSKNINKLKKEIEDLDRKMITQIENLYLYIAKKIEQSDVRINSLEKQVSSIQMLLKEQITEQKSSIKDIENTKKEIIDLKKQLNINKQ